MDGIGDAELIPFKIKLRLPIAKVPVNDPLEGGVNERVNVIVFPGAIATEDVGAPVNVNAAPVTVIEGTVTGL
jgi:hypothetical protein